ncbi:hypothetical protein PENARI_c310G06280, partial [Penicillium arizonense]|jgi:transposase
MSLH